VETAELLRRARADAGLTLAELARRTGVRESRLCDYEHGRHQPSADRLRQLLRATGHELVAVPLSPGSPGRAGGPGRRPVVDVRRNGEVLARLLSFNDAVPFAALAEAAGRSAEPPTWAALLGGHRRAR